MSDTSLHDLMLSTEPLCPELADTVQEMSSGIRMVHHPLLVGMLHVPAIMNAQLEHKKEAVERAFNERNWSSYVGLHERPYRIDALLHAVENGLSKTPKLYWENISWVWMDSENIHENFATWIDLWKADVPQRYCVMTNKERKALRDLPTSIPIWRGVQHRDAISGMSWTINRDKAIWFAKRWSGQNPLLIEATILKKDVLAYFSSRNESEIVVDPTNLFLHM